MIRKYHHKDFLECVQIVIANWDHDIGRRFESELELNQGHYFVFERRSKIEGFVGIMPSPIMHNAWIIPWINVRLTKQSKGVGGKLLEHAVKHADKNDGTVIHLMTQKPAFFKKHRFEEVHHYVWGGWSLMSLQLEKVSL